MQVTRVIDQRVYPRRAIDDARQAFREYCSLRISPLDSKRAQLVITVKDAYRQHGRQVALEFLNYALDRAAEIQFKSL